MTLDYLSNINSYGEHLVRIYNFNQSQAAAFYDVFKTTIIENRAVLDLSEVLFIDRNGINLKFRIFPEDEGLRTNDGTNFFCDMTYESFENMLRLMEPFCHKETRTYQYLYDLDIETDLIFSPEGTWDM
ncbi:hypothetical protein SAMN06298216_4014 [Spirosomataceae bacterium TFI 002]|nr:hypothetical protein SAMN06298216_4014 [Spirosomataceae bacterium TFI 002]